MNCSIGAATKPWWPSPRATAARALPAAATTAELVAEIESLANDQTVHAILVQHPVPRPIDRRAVFEAIPIAKDVDGVTAATLGRVILGIGVARTQLVAEVGYALGRFGLLSVV